MADEEKGCYVGFDAAGCLLAAVVDEPDHAEQVSKDVAEFIRGRLRVERQTVGWVRGAKWGHVPPCPRAKAGEEEHQGGPCPDCARLRAELAEALGEVRASHERERTMQEQLRAERGRRSEGR